MKTKIIIVAVLGILLYSCSPKVVAPVAEVPKVAPPTALALGKTSYENNCARCHKLYAPTDFSKADWAPILTRMQMKAKLDDATMVTISDYISSQL